MDGDAVQLLVTTYKEKLMQCSNCLVETLFGVSYRVGPVFCEMRNPRARGDCCCAPRGRVPLKYSPRDTPLSRYAHSEKKAAAVGFVALNISYESVMVVEIDPWAYSRFLGVCLSNKLRHTS